jgi:hypothetical protein
VVGVVSVDDVTQGVIAMILAMACASACIILAAGVRQTYRASRLARQLARMPRADANALVTWNAGRSPLVRSWVVDPATSAQIPTPPAPVSPSSAPLTLPKWHAGADRQGSVEAKAEKHDVADEDTAPLVIAISADGIPRSRRKPVHPHECWLWDGRDFVCMRDLRPYIASLEDVRQN